MRGSERFWHLDERDHWAALAELQPPLTVCVLQQARQRVAYRPSQTTEFQEVAWLVALLVVADWTALLLLK